MIYERKKKGFTVIELIIVMTLTVVVLGIIWTMFSISNKIISDVTIKSDLQREGQAIQENLSTVGMQAIGIEDVIGDETTGKITSIKIKSYNKEGNEYSFEIKNDETGKFSIDGKNISRDVESVTLDPQIIKDDNATRSKYNNINFTITLSKKKNYNNEIIIHPINIKTVFRNKKTLVV